MKGETIREGELLKPADRKAWILKYVGEHGCVDVLDSEFVTQYIVNTAATHVVMGFGAPRCSMLSRDLKSLFDDDRLQRSSVGLTEHYSGFPNWVWSYRLK